MDAAGKTRANLDRLVAALREALEENLRSVVLYGSAARGEHSGATPDLNLMVVVRDAALPRLEAAARAQRSWVRSGNRPLLFVTPEWIRSSTDVFPMEFLDMLEAHTVVHGSDPLEGLAVSPANLRLQCESELRSAILKLRASYLEVHDSPRGLLDLLAASLGPVAAVARAALRLAGEPVPARSDEVFDAAARCFGLDAAPFKEAAAVRRAGRAEALPRMTSLVLAYFSQVEALGGALDSMAPPAGALARGPRPD